MLDDPTTLALALFAALCIGLAKAGFSGISLVSVVLLADIYGAKASVGIALPLLIVADLMAYSAFRRHGSWGPVWRLLPATLIGLVCGYFLLGIIDDHTSRKVIAGCVLVMTSVQVLRKLRPEAFLKMAESRAFGNGAGVMGGFSTMMANAAGPVIQLYLLAKRIPKMELIGIGARFFLLVNLIKVPLGAHLNIITSESLLENAKLLPGVFAGIFLGRWLIGKIPQAVFEWMIVGFAALAAVRLLFG